MQKSENLYDILLERLLSLDIESFAHIIICLLDKKGFENIELISTHEQTSSVHIRASYDTTGKDFLIDARRWTTHIQSKAIRDLRKATGADKEAILISTSALGSAAMAEARLTASENIRIIDAQKLAAQLIKHEIGVKKTLEGSFELTDFPSACEATSQAQN